MTRYVRNIPQQQLLLQTTALVLLSSCDRTDCCEQTNTMHARGARRAADLCHALLAVARGLERHNRQLLLEVVHPGCHDLRRDKVCVVLVQEKAPELDRQTGETAKARELAVRTGYAACKPGSKKIQSCVRCACVYVCGVCVRGVFARSALKCVLSLFSHHMLACSHIRSWHVQRRRTKARDALCPA